MKKVIAIVLAVSLLVIPLTACNKKANVEIEVYTDQRLDDDGTVLASCRYEKPVISGGNKGVADAINTYFDDWLRSSISWFNEVAGMAETDYNLQKEINGNAWEDDSYWFADEVSTSFWMNRNILTVVQNCYSFTGGVHGNYGKVAVMFNLSNGNQVSVIDMTKDFSQLDSVVRQEIDFQIEQKIRAGEVGFFDGYEECVEEWSSRTCYFTEEGLAVIFGIYDIASYAAGEQKFIISYEKIQEYLNDNAIKMLELR